MSEEKNKKVFVFEEWAEGHRPETVLYLKSLRATTVSLDDFIRGYKKLGLLRTSPSKGRGLYKYLVKVGYFLKAK